MQRRTQRVVAMATLFVGTILVAGCSNASGPSDGSVLTLTAVTDQQAALEPIIAAFEDANPGITVDATFLTGNDFAATENTQIVAGNATDIISVYPGTGGNVAQLGALQENGYLLDLSGQEWTSDISEGLRPVTDVDGKTYVWPGVVQPLGAFYNTNAIQEAGLSIPTTWSELLTYCSDATAAGKVAFSLGLQDQWVAQLVPYALAPTLVYGPEPDWNEQLVAGEATFPDSAWLKVEQQYLDMDDAGCFTADPNGISFDNTLPPVAAGDALGVVQVGGIFGNLQGQNEDVVYDLQPLPATDDPADTAMAAAPSLTLGVYAKSDNTDLALQFLSFLAEPENTNDFATTLGGVVPAIPNDTFDAPEVLTTFNDLIAEGRTSAFPDNGWPNAEIQNAHLVGIQNMFLGSVTPEQLLQSMQDVVE